jgi:hypothetical protein
MNYQVDTCRRSNFFTSFNLFCQGSSKKKNGKILKPERLVVRDGQPAFDLFRCRFYDGGTRFYVSSRLKQAMEAAGITGVRFEAIPCLEANDIETM